MDTNHILITISVVTIACAVFEGLLSFSKGKHAFRLLCGVVILYVCISPLAERSFDSAELEALFTDTDAAETLETARNQGVILAAEESLQTAIRSDLDAVGITASSVEVTCIVTEHGIAADSIEISGPFDARECTKIQTALSKYSTDTTKLIISSEDAK